MKTMHELFDGSDAQELGSATAENALLRAEALTPAGGRPAPILIGDVVAADCAELRDIAWWFESHGKPMQGDFLRKVADRHEVFSGHIGRQLPRKPRLLPNAELRGDRNDGLAVHPMNARQ